MKFIQIALASDVENGEILYALGQDGEIYEKTYKVYSPGSTYKGKSITRGRASTDPFLAQG